MVRVLSCVCDDCIEHCYSVRRAAGWEDVPVEEILEDYPGGLYDSPDSGRRRQLDEDEVRLLPQVDEEGKPIHLYCVDGYPVQRRMAEFHPHAPPYGVLLKADKMQDLFTRKVEDLDDEGRLLPTHIPFTFYPQAGLRSVGHFQAQGLIAACYPQLANVNKLISAACQPSPALDPQSDDDDFYMDMDEDEVQRGERRAQPAHRGQVQLVKKTVVHPISSQGYNSVTHNTRGRRAQHHEVQTGRVTGALAGAWATGKTNTDTASDLLSECNGKMPHDSFADKIRKPTISRDMRLENVYWIDMDALPAQSRHGG